MPYQKREYHGMTRTPEHRSWNNMRSRCLLKNNPSYHDYGGRGITICPEWVASFTQFYADMGPKPEETTLERIDNDLGYSPENCRWASRSDQNVNRRSFAMTLTHDGKTMSIGSWAKYLGRPLATIYSRIQRKLPIEMILSPENFRGWKR